MRIGAIQHCNYAQNNSNNKIQFKGLVFSKDTLKLIGEKCSLKEIETLKAAAADKIDLRKIIGNDASSPVIENILLKSGSNAEDLKLLYEPFIDSRYNTINKNEGLYGSQSSYKTLYYWGLGGKFKILNCGTLPRAKGSVNHFSLLHKGCTQPLGVDFVGNNSTSSFTVSVGSRESKDVVDNILRSYHFIPNEACPIPTKDFVRELVRSVYNHMINQERTAEEISKLAEENKVLRAEYARKALGEFVV